MLDIIITLANEMDVKGRLNSESEARLKSAAQLLNKNPDAKIAFPGWAYRNDSSIAIADAFKRRAINEYLIAESAIFTELNSRDTVGDAIFTKVNIVEPNNYTNIAIVSSDFHIDRCKLIFNFVYGERYNISYVGAHQPVNRERQQKECQSIDAFNSTFNGIIRGCSSDILKRLTTKHPFYNGEVYPKSALNTLQQ